MAMGTQWGVVAASGVPNPSVPSTIFARLISHLRVSNNSRINQNYIMNSKIAIIPKSILSASHTSSTSQGGISPLREPGNAIPFSFLRLPHPRTGCPALFLPYISDPAIDGQHEILEIQAVDPPASRSWFTDDGIILEDGRLLLMTPIDPAFLLLPLLWLANSNPEMASFQTADAIVEAASQTVLQQLKMGQGADDLPNHKDILHFSQLSFIPSALSRICDSKEIDASTKVYRYSSQVTCRMLQAKVDRLSSPEMASSTRVISRALSKDGLGPNESIDLKLREVGRIKIACELLSQYLPHQVYQDLLNHYDFKSLDDYIHSIRPNNATVSNAEPKGKPSTAGLKKRKAESQVSRGAQKLQKTDTSKMPKLTSFFGKAKSTS